MKRMFTLLAAAAVLAVPALADTIVVEQPYARSSGPSAVSGAAFMVLVNIGTEDERVIAARSDVAERVELHTHLEDANGVMRMVEVEDGFVVPAGASHALQRGGDHVMLMGLRRPLEQGDTFPLTLVFESGTEVTLDVPVDLERMPMPMGHGG